MGVGRQLYAAELWRADAMGRSFVLDWRGTGEIYRCRIGSIPPSRMWRVL